MEINQGEVLVLERGLPILSIPAVEMERECPYCGKTIPRGEDRCEECSC